MDLVQRLWERIPSVGICLLLAVASVTIFSFPVGQLIIFHSCMGRLSCLHKLMSVDSVMCSTLPRSYIAYSFTHYPNIQVHYSVEFLGGIIGLGPPAAIDIFIYTGSTKNMAQSSDSHQTRFPSTRQRPCKRSTDPGKRTL